MSRRYSVEEIDEMRALVHRLLTRPGQWYQDDARKREVEEHVRTYMLNGTRPAEIKAEIQRLEQAEWDRYVNRKYSMLRLGRILLKARS